MDLDQEELSNSSVGPNLAQSVRCDLCCMIFSSKGVLQTHVKTVHEKLKPFKCDKCPRVFAQNINLSTHVKNKHTGYLEMQINDQYFECNQCTTQIFKTKTGLKRHMMKSHEEECILDGSDLEVCGVCQLVFSTKGNLKTHIKNIHESKRRPFACRHCKAKFNQKGNLESHIEVRHEKIR